MNKPELPEWIERIREREKKATKGNVVAHETYGLVRYGRDNFVDYELMEASAEINGNQLAVGISFKREADKAFYSHARQDIPALLQHCLKLREAIEQAAHDYHCAVQAGHDSTTPCNCWKSEALNSKPEGVL